MTADLVLLLLAVDFLTAGLCHLVIALTRIGAQWFSEALNGCAESMR